MKKIESLCQHPLITIDQSASLREAAALMRRHHVGALAVTADQGASPQVVGLLTDRDLVVEGLARTGDHAQDTVGPIASRKLAVVAAEADVSEAVVLMREAGVRRLLVVQAPDNRVIGLVALEELLESLASDLGELAQALRNDIAREASERPVLSGNPRPVFLPAGTPGMPWPGRPVLTRRQPETA